MPGLLAGGGGPCAVTSHGSPGLRSPEPPLRVGPAAGTGSAPSCLALGTASWLAAAGVQPEGSRPTWLVLAWAQGSMRPRPSSTWGWQPGRRRPEREGRPVPRPSARLHGVGLNLRGSERNKGHAAVCGRDLGASADGDATACAARVLAWLGAEAGAGAGAAEPGDGEEAASSEGATSAGGAEGLVGTGGRRAGLGRGSRAQVPRVHVAAWGVQAMGSSLGPEWQAGLAEGLTCEDSCGLTGRVGSWRRRVPEGCVVGVPRRANLLGPPGRQSPSAASGPAPLPDGPASGGTEAEGALGFGGPGLRTSDGMFWNLTVVVATHLVNML